MNKLKRGEKHPSKDLIFWQYHHPYFKETNGECWLSLIEFEKRRIAHNKNTLAHKKKYPLMCIVNGALQRDKQKYNTSKKNIIDLKFIKELLITQNNKCYWYNIELEVDSIEGSRNPAKLTIDRLDCYRGYDKDNVVLTSYAANCGRADCSIETWEKIIKNIKNGLNAKN